jgi:hypothetical protein|uniref:Uncharacterized protein n=1 Tax=candidate division WOR-3 bacterium TaxID=2052148 RepID=A0A7V3RHK7_UNCW3
MKYLILILITIIFCIIGAQVLIPILSKKDQSEWLSLPEVIPGARIISESEGIIEYKGKRFILGHGEYKQKKFLIEKLCLDTMPESTIIDMRFKRQIIVRRDVF